MVVMDKVDFKKAYKDLYLPTLQPAVVDVPAMMFVMVGGKGDPNVPDGPYAKAVGLLYTLVYTIKMSGTRGGDSAGYYDYVVPPLEGLWWFEDGRPWRPGEKSRLCWIAMIRQPEFVTREVFAWAVSEASKKKPGPDYEKARLEDLTEGLCVQCMHIGPYDTEPESIARMDAFARGQGLEDDFTDRRRHHEIYLSDPSRVKSEKRRTVVRHPVRKQNG
jgi:hypothetical protein